MLMFIGMSTKCVIGNDGWKATGDLMHTCTTSESFTQMYT